MCLCCPWIHPIQMHWITWTNQRWHKHSFCLPGYRTRKDTFQPAQLKLAQLKNWPRLYCNIFAEAVWAGAWQHTEPQLCYMLVLGDLASWSWYCQKKQMFTMLCFSDIASTTHWFPGAQLCAKVSSLLCQPFSTRPSFLKTALRRRCKNLFFTVLCRAENILEHLQVSQHFSLLH